MQTNILESDLPRFRYGSRKLWYFFESIFPLQCSQFAFPVVLSFYGKDDTYQACWDFANSRNRDSPSTLSPGSCRVVYKPSYYTFACVLSFPGREPGFLSLRLCRNRSYGKVNQSIRRKTRENCTGGQAARFLRRRWYARAAAFLIVLPVARI